MKRRHVGLSFILGIVLSGLVAGSALAAPPDQAALQAKGAALSGALAGHGSELAGALAGHAAEFQGSVGGKLRGLIGG